MFYYLICLCITINLKSNMLLLQQELSTLAVVQSPFSCASHPRFLYNPKSSCFMNATVQIIAQLYCYPEFRVAAHSRDATSSKTDAHTEFRHTFIEMLDNYHKPQTKMNDNQFRDYYHYTFLTTMDKIQFFNICKGDFTLDVLLNSISGIIQADILSA